MCNGDLLAVFNSHFKISAMGMNFFTPGIPTGLRGEERWKTFIGHNLSGCGSVAISAFTRRFNESPEQVEIGIKKVTAGSEDVSSVFSRFFKASPYRFPSILGGGSVQVMKMIKSSDDTNLAPDALFDHSEIQFPIIVRRCEYLDRIRLHVRDHFKYGHGRIARIINYALSHRVCRGNEH